MALVPQSGPSGAMSREGSRTALVVQNPAEQRDASALPELSGALAPPAGTLRLRGGPRNGPRVAWDEAVVDNEGLGRKKSKSTYLALEKCKMLNGRIVLASVSSLLYLPQTKAVRRVVR